MSDEARTTPAYPAAELPEATGEVHPLQPVLVRQTLVSRLIPTVDKIRQLYTDLGLRTYRVFLVVTDWSGGERGRGTMTELARTEILPTPRVDGVTGVSQILHATGLEEEGSISVSQISVKYSEDDLLGTVPLVQDSTDRRTGKKSVEFFWEVVEDRGVCDPTGATTARRRRFTPSGAPELSKDTFSWKINLKKQDIDRSRSGGSGRAKNDP
jgi:hypothetical protein